MNKIKTLIINLILLAIVIAAVPYHIEWCGNLILFLSWLMACVQAARQFSKDDHAEYIAEYNDPKSRHLPEWWDLMFYTAVIWIFAASGWFFSAVLWVIAAGVDLNFRESANKLKRMTTATHTRQLYQALKEYGRHRVGCPVPYDEGSECTCGFTKILKSKAGI